MSVPNIDIRPDLWLIVRNILRKHVPQYEVWAFGSRAKWTAKQYSDLDIAIITDKPLSLSVSAALDNDFSDSILPYKIDIVDWAATKESFRKIIERDKVVIQTVETTPLAKLSDVAAINPPRKVKKGEPVPFIEMAALPLDGRDISSTDVETRIAKNAGSHFQNGDTLLARITPCLENGKTAQVRTLAEGEVGEGSTEFIVLCGQEPADNDFVYYLCRNPEFREYAIARMEGTSGRQRVSWQAIADYQINLPSPNERRAIASVLGALDDKIELNRRTNETLEAIARALFKSWFVDFDGVADQDMQQSELGLIPKGWDIDCFANTVEIIGGGTPKTSVNEYWNGTIPWFSVVDAPSTTDVWVVNTEKKITQVGIDSSSTKLLPIGATIISARGTVGRLALVGVPMAMNQSCYGLKGKFGAQGIFNYFTTRELVGTLQQRTHGSVFDTITRDTLAGIQIVIPPIQRIDEFENIAAPLLEQIRQNIFQNRSLAALRDALLPKLLSGELRISSDSQMEAA